MSRVQFNLLPDVKLDYDNAQRTKALVFNVSILISMIAVGILIISVFFVDVVQKKLLSDANHSMTTYSQKLNDIPNLQKILTIQNQLDSLPALQQSKHITSRLYNYLLNVTPNNVFIGDLTMDTTAKTIEIKGTADTVETVNQFVDTLKFTTYTTSQSPGKSSKAFPTVVLTTVNRDDTAKPPTSYVIDIIFDPTLFLASQNVTLVVPPNYTTTRSVIDSPATNALFNGAVGNTKTPATKSGGQ